MFCFCCFLFGLWYISCWARLLWISINSHKIFTLEQKLLYAGALLEILYLAATVST